MKVKALKRLGDPDPLITEAAIIIVELDNGTPVAVACEYGIEGAYYVGHCNDPEFNKVLQNLGINQTIICENLADFMVPPSSLPRLDKG